MTASVTPSGMRYLLRLAALVVVRDDDGEIGRVPVERDDAGLPVPKRYRIDRVRRGSMRASVGFADSSGAPILMTKIEPFDAGMFVEFAWFG